MFKKPFKTKSNCQLKSSEKKKLLSRIKIGLPQLSDDQELFTTKDPMNVVRVTTYSGANISIYVHTTTPILFELHDVLYPTVFTLWKCPNLVYSFVTHEEVVRKLYNGADLMLPGVTFSTELNEETKQILNGIPVGVCTNKNRACVAVGQSMVSGKDILNGLKSGRAVKILHTFGDELEKLLEDVPKLPLISEIPQSLPKDLGIDYFSLGSADLDYNFGNGCNAAIDKLEQATICHDELDDEKDFDNSYHGEVDFSQSSQQSNVGRGTPNLFMGIKETEEQVTSEKVIATENLAEEMNKMVVTDVDMDELAEYCLLKSLLSKKLELPILTNLFYKNIMLNVVPDSLELNIKKTKHKKLSNMLKNMVTQGVLGIEDNKGVQTITSVNFSHPLFKSIKSRFEYLEGLNANPPPTSEDSSTTLEKPEEMREDLVVNKLVSPLFNNTPYQKGNSLTVAEAREVIVSYIKKSGMTHQSSQTVTLDPVLSDILCTRQLTLPWGDLMSKIMDKMGNCYVIRTSKDRVISGKGKLPFIEISTATRSGNKSVTLVNNLEKYGININEFARHCQHALAASTTTHLTPSGVQFQVQGNHKPYICALLVGRYSIPQRLILGYAERSKGKKGRK